MFFLNFSQKKNVSFPNRGEGGGGGSPTWEKFPHYPVFFLGTFLSWSCSSTTMITWGQLQESFWSWRRRRWGRGRWGGRRWQHDAQSLPCLKLYEGWRQGLWCWSTGFKPFLCILTSMSDLYSCKVTWKGMLWLLWVPGKGESYEQPEVKSSQVRLNAGPGKCTGRFFARKILQTPFMLSFCRAENIQFMQIWSHISR